MKILLDMNLSPDLVTRFAESGIEAVHWSTVGDPKAKDSEIMVYARNGGYVVFTHDLDFGTILAATNAKSPSVIQIRTQDLLSEQIVSRIIGVLKNSEAALIDGALVTIDEARARIRILPMRKS